MMKRSLLYIAAALLMLASCTKKNKITVEVTNNLDEGIAGYVVELPYAELIKQLGEGEFIVTDSAGMELPSQITYDSLFVFQSDLGAGINRFTIKPGTRSDYFTKATGRFYPERLDDLGWENDLMGFRAYGPGSGEKGERLFGYDIFLKRDTAGPILDMLYASDHNPDNWAKVDSLNRLRKFDESAEFIKSFSYHVDHGYGMDCYAVGPTLGAGTSALTSNGEIIYPGYYSIGEILDNGPIRFSAKLIFDPVVVDGDSITEVRIITLDAGSHFNRTDVEYRGIIETSKIVVGIVIHDTDNNASANGNTITYIDPTQGDDNGRIFISAISATEPETSGIYNPTTPGELPHVMATYTLNPGDKFTYYWGFGWDRSDVPTIDDWQKIVDHHARIIATPPTVKLLNSK